MAAPPDHSVQEHDRRVRPASSGGPSGPNACYRDYWWVYDSVAGIYCGLGINGQVLMIHHPANTVIAKFSTWPDRMDYGLADLTDAGLLALCAAV